MGVSQPLCLDLWILEVPPGTPKKHKHKAHPAFLQMLILKTTTLATCSALRIRYPLTHPIPWIKMHKTINMGVNLLEGWVPPGTLQTNAAKTFSKDERGSRNALGNARKKAVWKGPLRVCV